jgi:hypothetical protein
MPSAEIEACDENANISVEKAFGKLKVMKALLLPSDRFPPAPA